MNKDVQLYIGYMNDEQKNKFNLKDNDNVHLINLSNHIEGEDINDINCHYSELCVAYYVWKHQLRSDYVSIGQHRRYITPINFERLDNNEIQVFPTLAHTDNKSPYECLLKDGFNNYIILNFIKYLLRYNLADRNRIYDVIYNPNFEISYFNVFACNWKVFNDMCSFVFGFMQELLFDGKFNSLEDINRWNEDIKLAYNNERFLINENQLLNDYDWGRVNTPDRNIAAIFELLIPLYGKICYDVFFECDDKKLGLTLLDYNEETVYNEIFNWVSKNTFNGTLSFYIKTKTENCAKLNDILSSNWYGLSSGNVIVCNEFPEGIIELKLNEYIDTETPYDELNIDNIKIINT